MRSLALLLVIINLAYLGWATLIDVRPTPVAPTKPATEPGPIMLASERDAAISQSMELSQRTRNERDVSKPPTATATLAGPRCVSIGPFQDLTSAAQASARLKSDGHDSRQRLEQGQVWVGYWVHVPGFANREDAETAVARLKQNGMADAYVSLSANEGDTSNVISLGVFKESDRAQRLLAEAKALGFPAQITDRTRSGSVYWIDLELAPGQAPLDISNLGAQSGKIVRMEQRACGTP